MHIQNQRWGWKRNAKIVKNFLIFLLDFELCIFLMRKPRVGMQSKKKCLKPPFAEILVQKTVTWILLSKKEKYKSIHSFFHSFFHSLRHSFVLSFLRSFDLVYCNVVFFFFFFNYTFLWVIYGIDFTWKIFWYSKVICDIRNGKNIIYIFTAE